MEAWGDQPLRVGSNARLKHMNATPAHYDASEYPNLNEESHNER
jgi:hypothetical protein